MDKQIRKIMENHFKMMLEELDEIVDTDDLELTLEIKYEDFHCKLIG